MNKFIKVQKELFYILLISFVAICFDMGVISYNLYTADAMHESVHTLEVSNAALTQLDIKYHTFNTVTYFIAGTFFLIFILSILYIFLILKKYITRTNDSDKYLHTIFDVIPDIIITTNGKEIDRANPAMLQFFNYKDLQTFKNKHDCICDYFLGDEDSLSAEVDGLHWLDYISNHPNTLHKVCMNKDAIRHHFTVRVQTLEIDSKNRSLVIFTDVTEFEELAKRFELAIRGTNDALWDWNLKEGSIYFSPRWKEMLGYSDNELKNEFETWESRVHPDDLKAAEKEIQKSHANPDYEYNTTHRLRHKNGSWVWILDRGQTIFDENKKPTRMVGFHTDITKQKELEIQVHIQEEMMIAQSRHAAMGEMISMIAHQWRQPISVIAMDANNVLVDIELESVDNDSLKSDVSDILEQTQNLSKTIDDFRNFFKPNKIKESVLVSDVYMEAFRVIDKSLENNNIVVHNIFESSTPIKIFSRELIQVFINILKNAKEALQENREQNREIITKISETKTDVIVSISDNGGGMKKEVMEKIFEPYFSTKDEKNGTGLGLYMSKTIVEKHLFSTLRVKNEGEGACFTITLPIAEKVQDG